MRTHFLDHGGKFRVCLFGVLVLGSNADAATATDKNNPYYLWAQDGQLYLSIVDQEGAGSGEGNMKLVRLSATGKWDVVDCYYFGASYGDPQRDGDYFGFSQHLDRQEKESPSLCQNLDIVPLP